MISYIPIPYSLLKIKPDSRLTGNTYSSIIKALYSTRRPLKERVSHTNTSKYNGDIHLQMVNPITYEIMFDGDNKKTTPTFCFGVPGDVSQYIKQRIQGILPQSTLTFEEDYSNMFLQSYMYEYKYTKDNMLSLKTGENNFLQSILDLKNTILKGEKILFQIQMLPIGDTWKTFNDDKWDKVRDGKDVTVKGKAAERFFDGIYKQVQDILQVCDSIMGCEIKDDKKIESSKIGVSQFSTSSRNKKSDDGFMTTIHLFVKCKDKLRANMYATTVETSLRELEEDNRLVCGKGKLIDKVKRGLSIKGKFLGNIMSGKELASLVNIPNQKLQREFKIDSINMRQINAPKECVDSGSGIRLGTLEIHGETKPIYMPKDRDILAMPYWLLCGMGGGKTTALLNRANDIVMAKQGLIDINYTSKCELAYAIKDIHKDHIIINMADIDNIPAFMFPEVKIYDTDTPHDRKRKAGNCGNEIEYFINCVTCDTSEKFTTRMGQYLICAAKIVFIYNGMRVKTVFDILEDKNIRDIWIKKAIDC